MASNFKENNLNITGLEIVPYVPVPVPVPVLGEQKDVDNQSNEFSSSQHLDLAVQEEGRRDMETGLLVPLSVQLPEKVLGHELAVVEEQKTTKPRRLSTAKVVDVSSIYFKFIKISENPVEHALAMYDIEQSPEMEALTPGMNEESLLPVPGLLKGWTRETRQRPNGSRDKFYSHPTCTRTFRSVVEVLNFIKTCNNLEDAQKAEKSEELQGPEWIQSSGASSSNHKRRKNIDEFQGKFKAKIRKNSSVGHAKKKREQIELDEFYANAYRNLLNLSPSTPRAMEGVKKSVVEAFLADAEANLLRSFDNEEPPNPRQGGNPEPPKPQEGGNLEPPNLHQEANQSPEELDLMMIHELLNVGNDIPAIFQTPEPPNPQQPEKPEQQPADPGYTDVDRNPNNSNTQQVENPEQLNPQHGEINPDIGNVQERVMNELSKEEMEVVEVFKQGLGRTNHYQQVQQDIVSPVVFSPNFMDPFGPDFF